MRNKLKKRFTKKLRAAFRENDKWMGEDGVRYAYVTGINSVPYMSEDQAYALAKELGGHWKDYMLLCPIIVTKIEGE